MASRIEVLSPRIEHRALRRTVDFAAKTSRQMLLAAGVAVRVVICPGDDIAITTIASGTIIANQETREAALPAPTQEEHIVWGEDKEA